MNILHFWEDIDSERIMGNILVDGCFSLITLEEEQEKAPDDPLSDERCGFTRNEMEVNPPLSQQVKDIFKNLIDF